MGKEKKGKKGGPKGEEDSDVDSQTKETTEVGSETNKKAAKKLKKKSGRNRGDESDTEADISVKVNSLSLEDGELTKKKQKKKDKPKATKRVETDSDEGVDIFKSTKKAAADVSDDDDVKSKKKPTASKSKSKAKSVFELLEVESGDDGDHMDSEEEIAISKPVKKPSSEKPKEKSKKSKKKRDDEDDNEIDRILAELAMENDILPSSKSKAAKTTEGDPSIVPVFAPTPTTEDTPSLPSEEAEDKKEKKKKKKKQKSVEEGHDDASSNAVDVDEGDEDGTVKTAAQKRKEKKERDRVKKLEQNSRQAQKQPLQDCQPSGVEFKDQSLEPDAKFPAQPDAEEDDEADTKDKKKKKGKKEKEVKEDKKGKPGKKAVLAMQEALKKVREEEDKLRLEEEAKFRAEEEAENQRLEKIRLDDERKERKRIKEKERKEKLKAEGKLLTKAQKLDRQRAAATLEALRKQGLAIPRIGEKRDPQNFANRNRNKKPDSATSVINQKPDEIDSKESVSDQIESEKPVANGTEQVPSPVVEAVEEIKESWDVSTSEDEEAETKPAAPDVPKPKEILIKIEEKKPHAAANQKKLSPSSKVRQESDSGDSSSEEEGSSSEEESESESESDISESSEDDGKTTAQKMREKVVARLRKRRETAEKNKSLDKLRSPVVCVLGHVDTGKTKILDKIRHSHVQDSEAGGITQQIGATMVPDSAVKEQCKNVKSFNSDGLKLPGLLIIDTPGHESFSNLRSRGSSLCDIAILVVDIMHGLEPQTIESINLLKNKKTPFVVALNKIDRLYEWKPNRNKDVRDVIKTQAKNTQFEFESRVKEVLVQFAEQGLNAKLFYENDDPRTFVSLVPTSAITGDGMGNLMWLIVELNQTMLNKRLMFSDELQATVLEVKAIPGLGTTIDVILVNGRLKEGDTIVVAGYDGAVVTQIRSLLMPQPLKELRVKNPYEEHKVIEAAQGIKITGRDLDKAIAGLNLLVAHQPDEVEICRQVVERELKSAMSAIKLTDRGVYVQASTLGSLEALLEFLKQSKIPFSGIRIGPVVKKDVMKASIMLEHDSQYAVILAFDVKIEKDAQEMADREGVKIFSADIIYHLFDKFTAYKDELKSKKREEFRKVAVFPCKLRILPQFIFNSRDPIVVGVCVEAGVVQHGTPICVPSKEFVELGYVSTIELNHKTIDSARKGQEVCIKIEPVPGDTPKMLGRHFEATDILVSKITRQSIDACKDYFRDDLQKADWQLMVELKKLFQIL